MKMPSAFRLPPSAFRLPPSAFRLPLSVIAVLFCFSGNLNAQATTNDPVLNSLCNYLIQPSSSPGLEIVGDFQNNFSNGLEAAILMPKGTGGPLRKAYQNCSPGELAFVVIDDGCNQQVDFTLTLDVPSPRSGPQEFQIPFPQTNILVRGNLALSTTQPPSTNNGVTTINVSLNPTPFGQTRFGAIVITYNAAASATSEVVRSGARLLMSRPVIVPGCPFIPGDVWGDLPEAIVPGVRRASMVYGGDALIRANQFGTGNNEVLILGNNVYADNVWPASQPGGVRFAMAPNSTLSFGDANNVVAGLTVPNGQFFPCSSQRFNTVEIGPNSNVTFTNSGLTGNKDPLIYGAITGVTVQDNAQFTMNAGEITSCITGLTGERAQAITLSNVGINQDLLSYTNSNFRANGARGIEGINLRTTDGASPNPGQYTFSNVSIDNFTRGLASGIRSSYRGPFTLTLQNSTITNSRDGVLFRRGLGATYQVVGNNITVEEVGLEFVSNRNSGLAAGSNIISAGLEGISVNNPGDNFFGAVSNQISDTEIYGIRIRSRNELFNVNSNIITMASDSEFRASGVGVFRNNAGLGIVANNQITTGNNTFNFGIFSEGSNSMNISTNSILLTQSQSTGIVIADSDNTNTNCNQVTTVRQPGSLTAGMELNTNSIGVHSCNLLNNTEKGMQLLGGNVEISYTSNTFNGNSIGLLVGGVANSDDGLADVTIGGLQLDADNMWLDAQPNRVARHSTNPFLRDLNYFSVKSVPTLFPANGVGFDVNGNPLPVIFQNIPSLDVWFEYSGTNTNPNTCPNACSVLPPTWPSIQPCLPEIVASQDSDFPTFQQQQARLNAKYASDFDQTPCDDNVLSCYQTIADLEQEFYNLFGPAMDQEIYEMYRSLLSEEQGLSEGTVSEEFLDEVLSLFDSDTPDEAEIENDLELLLVKLSDFEPCEEVTALWQESLELAIKQELPDGLSESEQADFNQIANKCASFEGPGVHIARSSLGVAVSDGQTCSPVQDSEQLIFKADKDKSAQVVFPNPVAVGSSLSFSKPITGLVEVTDSYGKRVAIQYIEDGNNFFLPKSLTPGMYIIQAQNGEFSTSIAVFK